MSTATLIEEIIRLEWQMFDVVQNNGGRASCQNDRPTFEIMRKSQFYPWQEAILNSYYHDLQNAQAEGRNLITEKYARMMAETHPNEYQEIAPYLPSLDQNTLSLVEQITAINMQWEQANQVNYPYVRAKGRPMTAGEASARMTSVETYLRGELQTYSFDTLTLLATYTQACFQQGRNLAEENLAHMVQAYGYPSLAVANEMMKTTNS